MLQYTPGRFIYVHDPRAARRLSSRSCLSDAWNMCGFASSGRTLDTCIVGSAHAQGKGVWTTRWGALWQLCRCYLQLIAMILQQL